MKKNEHTQPQLRVRNHSQPGTLVSDISSSLPESETDCDVLIVGGGINGCGIARDLAGRGWRVVLCEKDDLAAHTSSSSTKLIHGGLRYLEYYEFSMVRKSLQEREVLLKSAPHIMWPLRFVMPHDPSMRPAWMIRLGLFMYDHLAKREVLPGSRNIDLRKHAAGVPLKKSYRRGFVYSDGWVDDARLVVLNAIDARAKGAEVLTRTRCISAQRGADHWVATVEGPTGQRSIRARAVVNAAGPWAEAFLRGVAHSARGESLATKSLRLVKGSHIVVKRLFEHDHAYIFQNPDKRIIFAIPYEQDFTLIGTTDIELTGNDPGAAKIGDDEISYLCDQASRYFEKPIVPADVVWTYSGVRPLLDDESGDPSAVTRDYMLESSTNAAPLLSVWGGKITTFRKLAEDAADEVGKMLGEDSTKRPAWTDGAFMAGGDLSGFIGAPTRPDDDFERFVIAVQARFPWLEVSLARRLARAYGARVVDLIGPAVSMLDMGAAVSPGLHERELRFLQDHEWAVNADDVLWRRSKLGLHYTSVQQEQVAAWLHANAKNN
ncbi:glycerol-3-phosphate dehydrogenase [Variovorax sp. LG9.2]|uniref:glycerol-3-phosphate dehydrogenase n=1 Tax=Variovorax sp. LG9.2 TaxID=3048626 RepID=UPI002B239F4D|nr:glycerol-3-phosphate dehydrogenase [Variovorax sp. LG9.2]MEB0059796.1 glycerol-3-phosphate dehydrogenase [Variovorax sp. LG9.2]